MPAGTKFFRRMLIAYAKDSFGKFVQACPNIDFTSFVDDEFLGLYPYKWKVADMAVYAVRKFVSIFEKDMGCSVAYDKVTSTSTDQEVAEELSRRLLGLAGPEGCSLESVPNLGVDLVVPGNRSRKARMPKKGKRKAKVRRLIRRYAKIRKWLKRPLLLPARSH